MIVQARRGPILVTFARYCERINNFMQNGMIVKGRSLIFRWLMILKVQEVKVVTVSEPLPAVRYGPAVLEVPSADAVVRDIEGDNETTTPPGLLNKKCQYMRRSGQAIYVYSQTLLI